MGECTTGTVSKTVDPVVAKVHSQEGEPPGPGRVPGQLHQAVVVPHMHVSAQLTASHQQAVERKGQSSVSAQNVLMQVQHSVCDHVQLRSKDHDSHLFTLCSTLTEICLICK